jgi:membrane protein implicated in regulation of membrane protease activity
MRVQQRMVLAMLGIAVAAIVTGSVLLVGYVFAGATLVLIMTLMIRRLAQRHGHRTQGRPKKLYLALHRSRTDRRQRRAA